jgi:hypothetical protein
MQIPGQHCWLRLYLTESLINLIRGVKTPRDAAQLCKSFFHFFAILGDKTYNSVKNNFIPCDSLVLTLTLHRPRHLVRRTNSVPIYLPVLEETVITLVTLPRGEVAH